MNPTRFAWKTTFSLNLYSNKKKTSQPYGRQQQQQQTVNTKNLMANTAESHASHHRQRLHLCEP